MGMLSQSQNAMSCVTRLGLIRGLKNKRDVLVTLVEQTMRYRVNTFPVILEEEWYRNPNQQHRLLEKEALNYLTLMVTVMN